MNKILSVMLLTGLSTLRLSAVTIAGTFDLDGNVTVTANTITWSSPGGPGTALIQQATGSFAPVNNTYADITTLINPPTNTGVGAVGVAFSDTTFITFPSDPGIPVTVTPIRGRPPPSAFSAASPPGVAAPT